MGESVKELIKILKDVKAPIRERIESASELYSRYLAGEKVPVIITKFAKKSVDELRELIDEGHYVKGTEEEVVLKGIYSAKVERIRKRLKEADLMEVAKIYVNTMSNVEKEIASEMLKGQEEKLKKEAEALLAASRIRLAEAMNKEAEFVEGDVPMISSPTQYRFLSNAQVKSVIRPSRFYAREAFKNGLWNSRWGNPEKYGINVDTYVYHVCKPANRDFVLLMLERSIWIPDWGNPEDYSIVRKTRKPEK